jgi:hypothetical protein
MKKVMYLYFVVIIIGTLILNTGCTNNVSKQVIKTEFEVSNEKVELEKASILSNKADILLPKSFSIMTEEMAKMKYPSERRPTIIYTNVSGSINIALNHTQSKATNSQISAYMDSMKKTFENLYPSAQWYNSSVEKVNGKKVGVLELVTPASDTEIYNLMWLTDLDGRLLISTFNCTKEQMNDWKPIAKSIMNSQLFRIRS